MRKIKNKKATAGWTMAKLISLILGVILLVLIVYGFSTKGFGPLKDRTVNAFNEVLILLNIKEAPPNAYDCKPRLLSQILNGKDVLGYLGLTIEQMEKSTFTLCGGECKVDISGMGSYRIGTYSNKKATNFDKWKNIADTPAGLWVNYEGYIRTERDETAKNYKDIYFGFLNSLSDEEKNLLKDFYMKRRTKVIYLYADGAGSSDDEKYVVWRDGIWYVGYNGGGLETSNGEVALNLFLELVDEAVDDRVSFSFNYPSSKIQPSPLSFGEQYRGAVIDGGGINRLIDSEADLEIDDDSEKEDFMRILINKADEYFKEVIPVQEEINQLKDVLSRKSSFSVNGKQYGVDILEGGILEPPIYESFQDVIIESSNRMTYPGQIPIYFRYLDDSWHWSVNQGYWMKVSENKVLKGDFVDSNVEDISGEKAKEIMGVLVGKDYDSGIKIIGEMSSKVKEINKEKILDLDYKFPIITLKSDSEYYGLMFEKGSLDIFYDSWYGSSGPKLSDVPIQLINLDGESSNIFLPVTVQSDYKLIEDKAFEDFKKAKIIRDFLIKDACPR
jgi:hypothetical protein